MIILDREIIKGQALNKIISSLREEITQNWIPNMPKIVVLCDMLRLNDVMPSSCMQKHQENKNSN